MKTGSGGDAASDAVARSTNGSTAAAENTAADIVTGLAANSASGYTLKANGDKLEITRSDGVDFAISAGVKNGSGDAASVKVAQSSDGSTVATEVAGALTAFNALSSARAELVFDTIESVGKLSEVGSGKGFEAYVSGPVVTKVVASPISSGNANEVADADTSTGSAAGLSIAVTFDEAMDQNTAPTLTLSDGASSLTLGTGSWNEAKTVFTQPYVVSDKGVDIEGYHCNCVRRA